MWFLNVSVPAKADDCQTGPLHIVSSSVRDPPARILVSFGIEFPEKNRKLETGPLDITSYTFIHPDTFFKNFTLLRSSEVQLDLASGTWSIRPGVVSSWHRHWVIDLHRSS